MRFSKFNNFSHISGIDYQLNETVKWEIGRKGSGYELELEKGFIFDISVPMFLWWLLSPHNKAVLLAAAVHDKLIEEGFDIAFASAEFRRAAIARSVNVLFAWCLFASTYLFLSAKFYFVHFCKMANRWEVR